MPAVEQGAAGKQGRPPMPKEWKTCLRVVGRSKAQLSLPRPAG